MSATDEINHTNTPTPEQIWESLAELLPYVKDKATRAEIVQEVVQKIGPCPDALGDTIKATLA